MTPATPVAPVLPSASTAPPGPLADADRVAAARQALACLDLTSLNDGDTEADVLRLCERAVGPVGRGHTAAVCVWPRFAALARHTLPREIAVAAVANFPQGGSDIALAVRDTREIVAAGAQEVDVVLPWRALEAAPALLEAVRRASVGLTLKVILETGELGDEGRIRQACHIALAAGADFLKTSTGKVQVNATPQSASWLLEAIAADPRARARVGFKPAGGIRSLADAGVYMALTVQWLGAAAVCPARFRIGASGLLNEIDAVLLGAGPAPTAAGSY